MTRHLARPRRLLRAAALVVAAASVALPALPRAGAATAPAADLPIRSVAVHGTDAAVAAAAARAAGLTVLASWDAIDAVWASGPASAVAAVAARPGVTRVEADRPIRFELESAHLATGAEDARSPGRGLLRPDGSPYDGRGVGIAVVDSGADGLHPFFAEPDGSSAVVVNQRLVCSPFGCLFATEVPDSDTLAAGGHGTHVAGIAAGRSGHPIGGGELRGTAPGASLVVLGIGAGRNLLGGVEALTWVLEHHADPCGDGSCPPIRVVNNSWTGGVGDAEVDEPSAVDLVVDALVAEGVTVVFAAGNSGGDGTAQRVSAESDNSTPGVLSVANYDDDEIGRRDGAIAGSSSRGVRDRPATHPDLAAPGTLIRSSCRLWLPICGVAADPDYRRLSGTSMAAPYIAGVVALLAEANPTLTPAEIENILEDTARPIGAGPWVADPANPGGLSSFDAGHGLVDVAAALARVLA